MKRADPSGLEIQVQSNSGGGSQMPAQISLRSLAKDDCQPCGYRYGGDGAYGGPGNKELAAGLEAPCVLDAKRELLA
ncbi:MAG: hypothetical protein HOP33_04905 [Verrucomicrobia bacterium]|nr:hypothetical protein [Verrucomicrobiota bacterium]